MPELALSERPVTDDKELVEDASCRPDALESEPGTGVEGDALSAARTDTRVWRIGVGDSSIIVGMAPGGGVCLGFLDGASGAEGAVGPDPVAARSESLRIGVGDSVKVRDT